MSVDSGGFPFHRTGHPGKMVTVRLPTGPALRMQTPDSGFNAMVELAWSAFERTAPFWKKA